MGGCPRCGSEEIRKLLNVPPPYLKNIIKGALFTGLRKGDLLNLRWSNIFPESEFKTEVDATA
jgi:integrase